MINKFASLKTIKTQDILDPKISILIRCRNEAKDISNFLDSLYIQLEIEKCEIIFLDSESTDSTVDIISKYNVTIYKINSEEFNYGKTCNLLCSVSNADNLIILSAHIEILGENFIRNILSILMEDENSIYYARQMPKENASSYDKAYLAFTFPNKLFSALNNQSFSNACSFFKKRIWKLKKFPEIHGSEDFIWSRELLEYAVTTIYKPEIKILHSHNESPKEITKRVNINIKAKSINKISHKRKIYIYCKIFIGCFLFSFDLKKSNEYALAHLAGYNGC